MKRELGRDELLLWSKVAQTIHPLGARARPGVALPPPSVEPPKAPPPVAQPRSPKSLEPGRLRRIARGRETLQPSLDLHGLSQDEARQALTRFLLAAQAEGRRAAVVVTGRGVQGDGLLRRRAPEWLAEPHLRDVVAGIAEAHRRHGGDGAFYVALKRRKPA